MNGLQNIVGGLLAFGFSFVPSSSPLKSWEAMFMTYGLLTVIWAVFVYFWMPDSPMRAKCWSEEDKQLMVERVRQNQTGLQNRIFRKEQVWDALTDPQRKDYQGLTFPIGADFRYSLCICTYPTSHHDPLGRHRCLRQYHPQIIRVQHLGSPTSIHGHRRSNNNNHAGISLPRPQIPSNDLDHDQLRDPLYPRLLDSHRHPILAQQAHRHAHRILDLLFLLRGLIPLPFSFI